MKSYAWPSGERPDGKPETYKIDFNLGSDIQFTLELSKAMRFHNLIWRTLESCQKHWPTIRPGERLQLSIEEDPTTRYLYVQAFRDRPPTDNDPNGEGWVESYSWLSNTIDSISDWKNEIARDVILERQENSCCPVCGDSESHVGDCEIDALDAQNLYAAKVVEEVMKMHGLLMADPGQVPTPVLLRHLTAATAYAREFLKVQGGGVRMQNQKNRIAEIVEQCAKAGFPLTPDQAKAFISLDKKLETAGYPSFMEAMFRIMTQEDE